MSSHALAAEASPPRKKSPFADVTWGVVAALAFGVAILVWLLGGDALPGGRWLPVHLFTLGVLSNAILALSRHFGDTLTRAPADGARNWTTAVFNLGAVTTMAGMIWGWPPAVAVGASAATAAILGNWLHLRRVRHAAVGARFSWIVRSYERAHSAFIHGALLGAAMGIGLASGTWYGAVRNAHLHVNVLGWAGVTLLATLVFFGPTMARTRIARGADDRAARMVRRAAHGISAAALLLLASGIGDPWGPVLRVGAAVGLAVFAWAATDTCRAVARAVSDAKPGAARAPIVALCRWFVVAAWVDVVVVAAGAWRLLDAVGLALLVGVLAQAIATTLLYLAPMLRHQRNAARDHLRQQLDRGATWRAGVFNLGAALVVATAAIGSPLATAGAVLVRLGWVLVVAALLQPAVVTWLSREPEQQ